AVALALQEGRLRPLCREPASRSEQGRRPLCVRLCRRWRCARQTPERGARFDGRSDGLPGGTCRDTRAIRPRGGVGGGVRVALWAGAVVDGALGGAPRQCWCEPGRGRAPDACVE